MSKRQPRIREYWLIKRGCGYSARYCRIILTKLHGDVDTQVTVDCISEEASSTLGFTVRQNFLDRSDLEKLMLKSKYGSPRDRIVRELKNKSTRTFNQKLEEALRKI